MNTDTPSTPADSAVPADVPESLLEAARVLVRQFFGGCFWFRHPDAEIQNADDIRVVIENLRENGDHQAWRAAQRLHRQFLQCR